MNKTYNILITGACGVTSRALVKSLMLSPYFKDRCNFIGTDVCYNLYGVYEGLYSKVYKVPYTDSPSYREIINQIIKDNDIEYAFIIPEPEVLYWSRHPFDVKFHKIPTQFAEAVIDKYRLYINLSNTNSIPKFSIIDHNVSESDISLQYPLWIRDYSEGTTSGAGAFCPKNYLELKSWLNVNHKLNTALISEYLPGRNLGCVLLYNHSLLVKYACLQRQQYLMEKVAVSGITGNTCKGKLLNDKLPVAIAANAVLSISKSLDLDMNGLVVVDMKEDKQGIPKITEINIRHIALTDIFALAGLNFAETQLLLLSGQEDLIDKSETILFPANNIFLRDVDGEPLYIPEFTDTKLGEAYPTVAVKRMPAGCR